MSDDYMKTVMDAIPQKVIERDPLVLIAGPLAAHILVKRHGWPGPVAAAAVMLSLDPTSLADRGELFHWGRLMAISTQEQPPLDSEPAPTGEPIN